MDVAKQQIGARLVNSEVVVLLGKIRDILHGQLQKKYEVTNVQRRNKKSPPRHGIPRGTVECGNIKGMNVSEAITGQTSTRLYQRFAATG